MEQGETLIQIGGHITHQVGSSMISLQKATVTLETTAGELIQWALTDSSGRYTFASIMPGQYRLRAVAVGLGEKPLSVEVPSPEGNYDLQFP